MKDDYESPFERNQGLTLFDEQTLARAVLCKLVTELRWGRRLEGAVLFASARVVA
jgi:hypothetical protein